MMLESPAAAAPAQRDIEKNIPGDEDRAVGGSQGGDVGLATTFDDSSPRTSSGPRPSTSSGSLRKEGDSDRAPVASLKLPAKRGTTLSRYIFQTFSAYRRIFTAIFIANLIAFTALAKENGWPSLPDIKNASSANIMLCILLRQENVVNLIYEVLVRVPHSAPLAVRATAAKVFHYGGVHSGCGCAAVVWFVMYTALTTWDFVANRRVEALSSMIACYLLVTMFLFILIGAHPRIRVRFHDCFEVTHRFAGWGCLMLFWFHTFLLGSADPSIDIGRAVISQPSFWFLLISNMCGVISWFRLRKRDVFPELLSDHAIRLHFRYRPMQPFYGIKLSDSPLFEWYAFATIPDHDENGKIIGFSVVVSNAGDWTQRHIQSPPSKLWIRGYPLHGLLYTSLLFKKIVLVATGSGIGPCLSLMYSKRVSCRILWSTPNPETVFGQKIIDQVIGCDPEAVIWNTRAKGRPDVVALTYQLLREGDCEAVFVISNPKVTKKIVYGMESRGIPAYGPIFDS